jgi:hypothetical protein
MFDLINAKYFTARCYHISSFSETKAKEMIDQSPDGFIEHTRHQLLRIYPKGTRTGSSNYEPLTYWNVGCQLGMRTGMMEGPCRETTNQQK